MMKDSIIKNHFYCFKKYLNKDFINSLKRAQWEPEQMKKYALNKLGNIVDFAYNNTVFYRDSFDKSGYKPGDLRRLEDINYLPVLTKDNLRKAIEEKTIFPKEVER